MRPLCKRKDVDPEAAKVYEEFRKGLVELLVVDRTHDDPPAPSPSPPLQQMHGVLLRYSLGHRAQAIRELLRNRLQPPH